MARQHLIFSVNVSLLVLTLLAVAVRFLVRIVHGPGLWWDDWSSLVALAFCILVTVSQLYGLQYGSGRHDEDLAIQDISKWLQIFYIGTFIYQTGIGLVKVSVLLFCRRIFPTRYVTVRCWILGLLTLLWTFGMNLAWGLSCPHMAKMVYEHAPHTCMSSLTYTSMQTIPSIVLDICILILPLGPLWKLQMPTSTKLAVSGIFGVAAFAIGSSIARFAIVMANYGEDWTFSLVPGLIWSLAELDVSSICSCLPVMKPLLKCLSSHRAVGYSDNTAERRSASMLLSPISHGAEPRSHTIPHRNQDAMSGAKRFGSNDSHRAVIETANLIVEMDRECERDQGSRSAWHPHEHSSFLKQIRAPIFSSRPSSSNGILA